MQNFLYFCKEGFARKLPVRWTRYAGSASVAMHQADRRACKGATRAVGEWVRPSFHAADTKIGGICCVWMIDC